MGTRIHIVVSVGELLDKISILQIKAQRITDSNKLRNVRNELESLTQTRDSNITICREAAALCDDLHDVNSSLWDVEDAIRDCERRSDFGAEFIDLARSVYKFNDRRSRIKSRLNGLFKSDIVEEKSYT